jgi:hypothetical protein
VAEEKKTKKKFGRKKRDRRFIRFVLLKEGQGSESNEILREKHFWVFLFWFQQKKKEERREEKKNEYEQLNTCLMNGMFKTVPIIGILLRKAKT